MTELGEVVNQIMKESFPSIVDEHFTANMENLLDSVGEGTVNWKTVIENFYPDLEKAVEAAEKDLEKVKIEDEVTDVVCDVCGRNMVVKYGPHGKFLACPGFPECHNTKPYLEKIGVKCPKCGKEMMRSVNEENAEETRKVQIVKSAISTLSFSELEAITHIFEEMDGKEGILVASKIADRVGITRSVIVNALRKFESAGVIESRSSGMKGTYIKVLNDVVFDELEQIKKENNIK